MNITQIKRFDGNNWISYTFDADYIYMPSNIQLSGNYTSIGNVSKGSNAAVKELECGGWSVSKLFKEILTKVLYPSKPIPSVSMSLSNSGRQEVGTSITPSFFVTFDPKTYAYGSESNKAAGSYTYAAPGKVTITLGDGETLTGTYVASQKGDSQETLLISGVMMTVTANTNYYGSAVSCEYEDGAIPLTNTGTTYADAQVTKGTASNSNDTKTITGYYQGYYIGTSTTVVTANNITSNIVRGLTKKRNDVYAAGAVNGINVPAGTKTIIIATPADKTGPSYVLNTTVNAPMTTLYGTANKATTIKVGGADATSSDIGNYSKDYNIWLYTPAEAYASDASLDITFG